MLYKVYKTNTKEAGVTLLLSMLILSAIAAVAFSVSAVALIEVQTSSDVGHTDVAYYNDQALTEDAIFSFKRKVVSIKSLFGDVSSGQTCSSFANQIQGPATGITSRTRRCLFNSSHILSEPVSTSYSTFDTSKKYYLYDPNNLDPSSQIAGYKKIILKNLLGTSGLKYYVCRLDVICTDPNTPGPNGDGLTCSGDLTGSGQKTCNLDIQYSYELSFANISASDALVQIETYGPDTTSPKGLPYLNKENVEIESTQGGLTRRVQVAVPTQ